MTQEPYKKRLPPVERLKQLLKYDPQTGILVWNIKRHGVSRGRPITGTSGNGHIRMTLDRVQYKAHRVIWKMVTGCDPVDQIDHIDGNPANNIWTNLREASAAQNSANRKLPTNNASGVKGVNFDREAQKWKASICLSRHQLTLGYFEDINEAAAVVAEARAKLHGEFARAA